MKVPFIDLHKQHQTIKPQIDRAINDVMATCDFIGGRAVYDFEKAFAKYCGASNCIGVGSGTDALYLSLRALGIGPGDEVITAANSFIATSETITHTGANVVFVDCDPNTFAMDVETTKMALTDKTKAILPVHLFGHPADMPALKSLADAHGVYLLEDAAQAHGAQIHGKSVGTFGHAGCFSFYPGKILGACGDAGAIITNDDKLASTIRMIANHGRTSKYDHAVEGVNSRLDSLQAAVLNVKLKHLDAWVEKRRNVARLYDTQLNGTGLTLPAESPSARHVYHLYVIRVPHERERLQAKLTEKDIASGIHYPTPLPILHAYRYLGHRSEDFPVATRLSKQILSLPIYPELTEEMVRYVCDTIKSVI